MRRSWRSRLADALLIAGSTLLGLLLLEGGLRLATGDRYLDVDFRGRHGEIVYEPNQRLRWKRIEWDVEVAINSRGFRDYEYETPAARSVVALGDSFTEGYGVDLEESWGRRLAARLEEAGRPWRVYISGIQARQPVHYFEMYDRFWKADPGVKLVVMGFCVGTDIEATPSTPRVSSPPLSTPYFVKRWLCEHSVLYNFVRRPARLSSRVSVPFIKLGLMKPQVIGGNWANEKYKDQWDFTIARVIGFGERLRRDGRQLVVMVIPNKEAVEQAYLRQSFEITGVDPREFDPLAFGDYFARRGREAGLPVLDLTRPLRAADEREPGAFYFKTDGHWTARGHDFAAERLAEFLRARRLGPFR